LWTTRAVLQSLPPLAQHYAVRLLCTEDPVPEDTLLSWLKPGSREAHDAAMERLLSLRILLSPSEDDGSGRLPGTQSSATLVNGTTLSIRRRKRPRPQGSSVVLNPHFRRTLSASLYTPHEVPWRHRKKLKADPAPPQAEEIDEHMHSRWDQVLKFLVGAPKVEMSEKVESFLLRTNLMVPVAPGDINEVDSEDEEGGERIRISPRGYEFLLQDIHVQMWRFAQEYISGAGASVDATPGGLRHFSAETVLKFLFQLSYCRVGEDYPVDALSHEEQLLLDDFVEFGFIYRRKRSDGQSFSSRFYPSSVACNLVFGFREDDPSSSGPVPMRSTMTTAPSLGLAASASGDDPSSMKSRLEVANLSAVPIIVQTNYQVVAYTTNELHFRILGLFSELKTILPNAVVALLTRAAFMEALRIGITAQQVIRFLESNAHPETRSRTSIIPDTVKEQLALWEQEQQRVKFSPGILVDFGSSCDEEDFAALTAQLSENSVLLWSRSSAESKSVVVHSDPESAAVLERVRRELGV